MIDDQDRVERKVYQAAYDTWTSAILESTQSAILTLVVTVTANLGALAMVYVSRDKLLDFIDKQGDFWIYACLILFAIGFFGAFAAIRLMPKFIKQLFFSLTIYLISIGVGSIRCLLSQRGKTLRTGPRSVRNICSHTC